MPFWKRKKKDKKTKDKPKEHTDATNSELEASQTYVDIREPLDPSTLVDKIESLKEVLAEEPTVVTGATREFEYMEALKPTTVDEDYLIENCQTAMSIVNQERNRYGNVLALEETRVQLKEPSPPENSDYVNANWIMGLLPNTKNQYIASQGPLPNTVPDFWQMIWEQNSCVILMLTREIENSRIKCARYWPNQDEVFFDFPKHSLTFLNEIDETDIIVREFLLKEKESGEERKILQFQYIAWPDYGIPSSASTFLKMMKRSEDGNHTKGPLTVHCSAGIGRTGTFCAVHSVLQQYKAEKEKNPSERPKVSIVDAIISLRLQRLGMVQSEEQYLFIHMAINEGISNIEKYSQICEP